MNANTQLPKNNTNTIYRLLLLLVGVGIAALTIASIESSSVKGNNGIAREITNLENLTAYNLQMNNKNIRYHNFLATYFLQESSYNRTLVKSEHQTSPVITLAKLPISVAINAWSSLKGQ